MIKIICTNTELFEKIVSDTPDKSSLDNKTMRDQIEREIAPLRDRIDRLYAGIIN